MARGNNFIVRLRANGQDHATVTLAPGCDEVLVGRSHTCALCTPSEDYSVSGRHARLFWKGNSLWLEDTGSRNGVFYRHVRLQKPHKVSSGDMFVIGSSSLICEREDNSDRSNGKHKWHRLEYLNGDKAGRQIDICPKEGEETFTVGLDPANALMLPDMLVSRRHAFFETKENGECWLHDCGSRNGTYVNGEPLRGKERLLKDNDKISIAYFDFRFLDRTVVHTRFFLWLKIFVVAATLCVMAAAYVAWTTASSTVEDHLRLAQQNAEQENFEAAHEVLMQARLLRNAGDFRSDIDRLEAKICCWSNTVFAWRRAQKEMSDGSLERAQKTLDPIVNGTFEAWTWNTTDAPEQKEQAKFAMGAIRTYFNAQVVLKHAEDDTLEPEKQAKKIGEAQQELDSFLKEQQADLSDYAYLTNVAVCLTRTRDRMESIRRGFKSVDEVIEKLDKENPNFHALGLQLDEIANKAKFPAVRAYAAKYKGPCDSLARTKSFINDEFIGVNAMQFRDVQIRDKQLQLPPVELCSRHGKLSYFREKLEKYHQEAQSVARNLETMVTVLAELGIVTGKKGAPVDRILNMESWKTALTFSCLKGKVPSSRRQKPVDAYDQLLCVEYTFENLQALPKDYDNECLDRIGFSPDCVEARTAFDRLDVFVNFVEARRPWVRRGDLGRFYAYCRTLLESRDKLVADLKGFEGSPRARLVARFYSGYFSKSFSEDQRRELAEEFKKIQHEVADLNEKYENSTSNPIEQIRIRAIILDTGIPGDVQIRPKWVSQSEGGMR